MVGVNPKEIPRVKSATARTTAGRRFAQASCPSGPTNHLFANLQPVMGAGTKWRKLGEKLGNGAKEVLSKRSGKWPSGAVEAPDSHSFLAVMP